MKASPVIGSMPKVKGIRKVKAVMPLRPGSRPMTSPSGRPSSIAPRTTGVGELPGRVKKASNMRGPWTWAP